MLMRMTTQQKLDCLLKHFDASAERQGDGVVLNNQDITVLMKQCRFADLHEIAFYIRSLDERGLCGRGVRGRQHDPSGAHHH